MSDGLWTPSWVLLVMLAGLLVLIVAGIASAVLLGLWQGRRRRVEPGHDGEGPADQR